MILDYFSFENFRSFKSKTDFDLAPISILTGTNSSGKSSLIKAIALIQENIATAKSPLLAKLDFMLDENNLGGFSNVINCSFDKNTDSLVSFEFPITIRDDIRSYDGKKWDVFNADWRVLTTFKVNNQYDEEGLLQSFKIFHSQRSDLTLFEVTADKDDSFRGSLNIEFIVENLNQSLELKEDNLEKYPLFIFNNNLDYDSEIIDFHWEVLSKHFKYIPLINEDIKNFVIDELCGIASFEEYAFEELENYLADRFKTEYSDSSILIEIFDHVKQLFKGIGTSYSILSHNLPSIRGVTKRLYSNKDEFPLPKASLEFLKINFCENSLTEGFIKFWLQKFGIGEQLLVERREGAATAIYVQREGRKILLADLGFGITQFLPILFKIVVSYSDKSKLVIIEEPEANLHPKFQSLLADLFIDAYLKLGVRFILETHSEYLVRKMQFLVAKKEVRAKDLALYYFEGKGEVRRINFMNDGRLDKDFGPGFLDEANHLSMELFKLNHGQAN